MDKKTGRIIIILSFLLITCFSWVLWMITCAFYGDINNENRALAEMPTLSMDNVLSFPKQYTDYINDNIPFRNYLITLNSAIDYFVFGVSSNDQVIIGKDNWLFYNSIADGNPIACYQGTNLFSDEELRALAENCVIQNELLKKDGKGFVIFVAPNKERVYGEKMPDQYGSPSIDYRALQVVEYLKNNTDIEVVYPYDDIMNAKNTTDQSLYYKTDTHWNSIGGYIGASALLSELGISVPPIDSQDISISIEGNRFGDLAGMINLKNLLYKDDYEYNVSGYDLHNNHQSEKMSDMDSGLSEYDDRKVLVIRDSFSTNMIPYLESEFENISFVHFNDYSYDDYIEFNPDIVVYETVERYIHQLSTFSVE